VPDVLCSIQQQVHILHRNTVVIDRDMYYLIFLGLNGHFSQMCISLEGQMLVGNLSLHLAFSIHGKGQDQRLCKLVVIQHLFF